MATRSWVGCRKHGLQGDTCWPARPAAGAHSANAQPCRRRPRRRQRLSRPPTRAPAGAEQGQKATTVEIANLRRTPGFKDKPANDILYEIPAQSPVTIIDGPETVDGLTWWNVRFTSQFGNPFTGWLAPAKALARPCSLRHSADASEPSPPAPSRGKFRRASSCSRPPSSTCARSRLRQQDG